MTTKEYVKIYKKWPSGKSYEGWKNDLEAIQAFNKELTTKYPWLTPRNRWTDNIPEDYDYTYTELDSMPEGWRIAFGDQMMKEIQEQLVKFNYVDKFRITQIKEKWGSLRFYCNSTPIGKLSETYEIFTRKEDEPINQDTEKYYVEIDHSEHYISYFDRDKSDMSSEEIRKYNEEAIHYFKKYEILEKCTIWNLINKYEEMSEAICINCGKPAIWESMGWISPYCEDCANEIMKRNCEAYNLIYKNEKLENHFTRIGDKNAKEM